MKKLALVVSLALLVAGLAIPLPAYAACPGFKTNPPLTSRSPSQPVTFSVNSSAFGKTGGYFYFKFQRFGFADSREMVANTGGTASVTLSSSDTALDPSREPRYVEISWSSNPIPGPSDQLMCTDYYQIAQSAQGDCSITITPAGPSIKDKITANATNNSTETLHMMYNPPSGVRSGVGSNIAPGKTSTVTLENKGVGTYDVWLEKPGGVNVCSTQFVVSTQGGAFADAKIGKVCDAVEGTVRNTCNTCFQSGGAWTAIGCIPSTPSGFIQKFMGLGVGIAGGIAFLLILFSGFQILTSVGNPEKLAAGRELMTAAISGLLLIVLSLFLLRLIGFSILGIPGFK